MVSAGAMHFVSIQDKRISRKEKILDIENSERKIGVLVFDGNADLMPPELPYATLDFTNKTSGLGCQSTGWRLVRRCAAVLASQAPQFCCFKRFSFGGSTLRSAKLWLVVSVFPRLRDLRGFSHSDAEIQIALWLRSTGVVKFKFKLTHVKLAEKRHSILVT